MAAKIFLNGSRWWLRLPGPSVRPNGLALRVSTGTRDQRLAGRIAHMVDDFVQTRQGLAWLARIEQGVTSLADVYAAHSGGNLARLEATLDAALVLDPDIEPLVGKWIEEHVANRSITPKLKVAYARQIRAFLPEGVRFPASDFSEDVLTSLLSELVDERSGEPLSGSTKRRYLAPLRLFYRYAKKRVTLPPSPFEDADWMPLNNPARMVSWDHATVLRVLGHMVGQHQVAMTLLFGTGMELGALLGMHAKHVGKGRIVVAPGTKNDARRDRSIYVDEWAWPVVQHYGFGTKGPLFNFTQADGGDLRDAFYAAQLAAGLIPEPPRSPTGVKLWGKVNPHTLHDCRHSYCYTRLLGDDGAPRQSVKFCSHQLGHSSEQMVMKIYGKCNMDERIRRLELAEARNAGQQETA